MYCRYAPTLTLPNAYFKYCSQPSRSSNKVDETFGGNYKL